MSELPLAHSQSTAESRPALQERASALQADAQLALETLRQQLHVQADGLRAELDQLRRSGSNLIENARLAMLTNPSPLFSKAARVRSGCSRMRIARSGVTSSVT
jgi:hypothetical protein